MKITPETALFQVPFGSHLYGTETPSSDYDYKVVCLPGIDNLLLNAQLTNRVQKPEGVGSTGKMSAGEAEYEYIPFQIFLADFYDGQTYALEIAFAVIQNQFEICADEDLLPAELDIVKKSIIVDVKELVDKFLTRNVKKMVGYAVSQSRNYGLKTERYTSMKMVVEQIGAYLSDNQISSVDTVNKLKIGDETVLLNMLLKLPHVVECEILNGAGGTEMSSAIEVCGKQFPYTTGLGTILKSLDASLAQYGDRVKKFDGMGVDWKALSHAIRITEQVIELCDTGFITFPRPNAEYLRDVKEGKHTIENATYFLTTLFNQIDDAVDGSKLKERTAELDVEFKEYKIQLLRDMYGISE